MELRSVEELMDLLHACRGARAIPNLPRSRPGSGGGPPVGDPVDLHEHALQTAALLRRSRPADKELQVAGLVHDIGQLLDPGEAAGHADLAADAIRALLGDRVSRLVRLHAAAGADDSLDDDLATLRQADESGRMPGLDAGVLEDWRTVLELVAARNSLPGTAGRSRLDTAGRPTRPQPGAVG
ncbi:HD domain-containing protein [Streptomyces avermitilis]|uniref:HD domain-containing protein n=1 Tax=Streptomyces avermitilis TaxID=33903 RepID=UPI0033A04329